MNKILKKLFNKKYMRGGNKSVNLNILILLILVLLFVYIYQQNNQSHNIKIVTQPATSVTPESQQNEKKIQNIKTVSQTRVLNPEIIVPQIYPILRNYDYRTLSDPLTPPYKRDDDMIPANVIAPDLFGIYTQGGPLPFIKVGKLIDNHAKNDEPYKFLILFGRRRYPGSNLYDYYATTTNRDDYLKFDLDYKNVRYELYTGNHVFIPELKKKYEVVIDRQMDFTYTPYM